MVLSKPRKQELSTAGRWCQKITDNCNWAHRWTPAVAIPGSGASLAAARSVPDNKPVAASAHRVNSRIQQSRDADCTNSRTNRSNPRSPPSPALSPTTKFVWLPSVSLRWVVNAPGRFRGHSWLASNNNKSAELSRQGCANQCYRPIGGAAKQNVYLAMGQIPSCGRRPQLSGSSGRIADRQKVRITCVRTKICV